MELEYASKMLESAAGQSDDPVDVYYRKLKTDMQPLDHSSDEFKMVVVRPERKKTQKMKTKR